MLNFEFLFDILVIYLIILLVIQVIKLFKPNIKIKMGEKGRALEEIGFLDIKSRIAEKGRATDVKFANDPMQEIIGTIVISEEKGQIRMLSGSVDSITGNKNLKKVGYVDKQGYIYKYKSKNAEPEVVGYLAKPSKPNEPTLVGERSWKDLWYSRRLNAYYGIPTPTLPGGESKPTNKAVHDPDEKDGQGVTNKDKEKIIQENVVEDIDSAGVDNTGAISFNNLAFNDKAEIEDEKSEAIADIVSALEANAIPEVADPLEDSTEVTSETEGKLDAGAEVDMSDDAIVSGNEDAEATESGEDAEANAISLDTTPYPSAEEKNYLDGIKSGANDVIRSILSEMVKVEGGTFSMGADPLSSAKKYDIGVNEGPVHNVTLRSFYIGKFPVTQRYWSAIMGYNHSEKQDDSFPVAPVSWEECDLFVKRLSYLTGMSFSLPTEAQWEYAARGGCANQSYIYSGSDNFSKVGQNDPFKPVGQKAPNALGVYDMSGLVREWCKDWYADSYSPEDQFEPEGPFGPADLDSPRHVVRSPRGNDTVTNRKGEVSNAVYDKEYKSYGFRLVCNAVSSEQAKLFGVHKEPELIGSARLCGYIDSTPHDTPISDEARAAAFSLFYGLAARQSEYEEYQGDSATGWRDTALLSSLIYSALFLIIYFINTVVFRYPLLGNQLNALIVMTAAFFVIWASVRFYKQERIEKGHSIQTFLDIFNKSVGIKILDIFIIAAGSIGLFLSYRYFDSDFVPLLFAIIFGCAMNLSIKPNAIPWKVNNPFMPAPGLELEDSETVIERPEGNKDNKLCDFDWDLDSFNDKVVHGHISMGIDSEDIDNLRMVNPYYLEMPSLYNNMAALKIYVKRMLSYLHDTSAPDRTLRIRYVLQEIKNIADRHSLNELDRLQFVLDFVQKPNIGYKLDSECREDLASPDQYMRYPDETLYDHVGDCKSKSFLAANMFYLMGYNVLLLLSTNLQHTAVAVAMDDDLEAYFYSFEDSVKEYKGRRYIFCETTNDGFKIGDIGSSRSMENFDIIIDLTHKEEDEDE